MSGEKNKKVKAREKGTSGGKGLWEEREAPSRGPKPTLTVEQIAQAAIRVADAEGLEAVSMQRIAREVDVTTMALYRYFSGKAALIEWMIDSAGGPVPDLGNAAKGWRARLKEWTECCSGIYRRHPWFLQAASARRRIMGPNEVAWLDAALGILSETKLTANEQHQAFLLLMGHVRSNAEFRAAGRQEVAAERWAVAMTRLLGKSRDRYPALMAAMEAGAFQQAEGDGLEFGLQCILDGIESLARRRKKG